MVNYLKDPSSKDKNRKNFLELGLDERAIIAVGGSYGGNLAAWLRMKFPQTFHGALASSAPILFSPETVSPYAFNKALTDDFASHGNSCADFIRKN